MHRKRLRPAWSRQELDEIYQAPHDHYTAGTDHWLRVSLTAEVGNWMLRTHQDVLDALRIADLSCGDGDIARDLCQRWSEPELILGDYAPGYELQGPIEETIHEIPPVDIFVLSETLEHLNDPDWVLSEIRRKSRLLVMSTPINEPVNSSNGQHYWSWDQDAVTMMLESAGWYIDTRVDLNLKSYYSFQIYGCS